MAQVKELLRRLWNEPATTRKFIVALLSAVGVALSVGLLPLSLAPWVAVAVAFAGSLGVYGLRNSPVEGLNVRFSAAQRDEIKRLTEAGQLNEAQELVLSVVQDASRK